MWEGQDYVSLEVGKEEVDRLLEKYSDAEWIEVDEEENRRIPFHRSGAMAAAHPCPLACLLVTCSLLCGDRVRWCLPDGLQSGG